MGIIRRGSKGLFSVCLAILIAGLAVSCSSVVEDEPEDPNKYPPTEIPRIEIYAGTAPITTTDGASDGASDTSRTHSGTCSMNTGTRSSTEPSRLGYCNADRLKIWIYKTQTSNSNMNAIPVKYPSFYSQALIDNLPKSGPYNSQIFSTYQLQFTVTSAKTNQYIGFALPALAYEENCSSLFDMAFDSPGDYTELAVLRLKYDNETGLNFDPKNDVHTNKYEAIDKPEWFFTPELFFNYLTFTAEKEVMGDLTQLVSHRNDLPSFYLYFPKNFSDGDFSPYLYGKLYRIVSQCNVSLTEIDSDEVERVELYLSNVPVQLQLSGAHGLYYNVTATDECFEKGFDDTKDLADNYVRVAATNEFSGGMAKLSCFLLPSLKGREMCIRVYYKGERMNEAGETIEYEDFKIQPKRDVLLYGDDAGVYAGGEVKKQADLWQNDNLYVYKSESGQFFSYANIRVNLSGRFSGLVSDNVSTGLNLSVSSEFEEQHDIKLK